MVYIECNLGIYSTGMSTDWLVWKKERNITSWVWPNNNTRYITCLSALYQTLQYQYPRFIIPATYQSKISLGPWYHQYQPDWFEGLTKKKQSTQYQYLPCMYEGWGLGFKEKKKQIKPHSSTTIWVLFKCQKQSKQTLDSTGVQSSK
jgi:hypothetical protein